MSQANQYARRLDHDGTVCLPQNNEGSVHFAAVEGLTAFKPVRDTSDWSGHVRRHGAADDDLGAGAGAGRMLRSSAPQTHGLRGAVSGPLATRTHICPAP